MVDARVSRRRLLAAVALSSSVTGCAGTPDGGSGASESAGSTPRGTSTGPDRARRSAASESTADVAVTEALTGLANPWGLAVLPDESGLLVTEQAGRLLLADLDTGDRTTLAGVPEVHARGQGGLLDVTLHPDFDSTRLVYFTYSVAGEGGSTTRVGRGRLDHDRGRLTSVEPIYTARPFVESNGHYGSRAVFDTEGYLYVSVGDRQFKDFGPNHVAQLLDDDLGSVLRLHDDGSIPDSNPFVDDPDASDAVFTYGNRNPQGLTIHPETGAVWETEYGERDGDEINVLEPGANYGWPVADNSCEYGTDDPVGVPHEERDDVVAPVYGWPCGSGGFPPSGTTFYDGEAFSDWRGDLFVAGLAKRYLAHFTVDGREVTEVTPLLADRNQRLRDVTVSPVSGHLYVAVDADTAPIYRIAPAD
ncbi:PQQ-dependent sugar dehydrogenase [Haloplanus salinus]|uniref:PQQ-dependent sugar dehydrogenase n=1 Tax=Haloplanus salinus TaxID=1126245 RepID=A0A368NDV0_9EURY|nr:PQQ-dependent sugar dehydrogenase [Haloplanus salinus]RCU47754.1 PQQ-dependent sugar dehydrogenase [Haloplanus salinus]